MSKKVSGEVVLKREITLNDIATMIEDLQADIRLSLLNDEEIILKLENLNSSSDVRDYE